MLRWHIGWFLAGFGSNKSLRLPPVPLLWTPMDLIDLEHVVDGLIKCLEAHKVLQVSRNGEKTGWKKVKFHCFSICPEFLCKNWVQFWFLYVGWGAMDVPVKKNIAHCSLSSGTGPDFHRVLFGTFFVHLSGPITVKMGSTPQDMFFYLSQHDWSIKVTTRRLELCFPGFAQKTAKKGHFQGNGCLGAKWGLVTPWTVQSHSNMLPEGTQAKKRVRKKICTTNV